MAKKTKGKFKVEIRKTCAICGEPITKPRWRTYCSDKCRNKGNYKKVLKKMGKQAYRQRQREYLYKKSLEDKREKIQCLICNKWYRQVGSHIWNTHKITAREYRKKFGFDVKKGQLPADYRKLKAEQAIECGGYKNLKKGKKHWFKKGDEVGDYERSDETIERLQMQTRIKRHKRKMLGCIVCNTTLTGNQTKYCCKKHRQQDYKIKYNKHKTKLFNK